MKQSILITAIFGLAIIAGTLFTPAQAGQGMASDGWAGLLLSAQDHIPLTQPVQCCHDSGCFQAKNPSACKKQVKKNNLCPSSQNKVKCKKGTCNCK